ncbi:MAG: hypothetical protein KGL95_09535, partial [Patescibacteria group bacterium]|nr:hypothetical protein [Patescibacteria group bacterium]
MGSIELGVSLARAALKTRRDLRDPIKRQEVLFGERAHVEQNMVDRFITKHKRWASVIGLMTNFAKVHGVPSEQIPGLTDVILLVLVTDAIIDRPGKFKNGMSANDFRNELEKESIEGTRSEDGIPYTVGQFLQATQD